MDKISLFWFRRDLRFHDNAGLFAALKANTPVLPIFIFDTTILETLEDKADARVNFIHQSIAELRTKFQSIGSDLKVMFGLPLECFKELHSNYRIEAVYTNRDYDPQALERDKEIANFLATQAIEFHTYKDQVIFEGLEIAKEDGSPYVVYTPYSRAWKKRLNIEPIAYFASEELLSNLVKTPAFPHMSLIEIGFEATNISFPPKEIPKERILNYDKVRDLPAVLGTSRLGLHFRFGTVSIRETAKKASSINEKYFNELIWRDFYQMILANFPRVVNASFKTQYDRIPWRNEEAEFEKWCEGKTGYPLVDAGMRELNTTGFMHNRVRMVVASFLCKHLLIDWRWGQAYFAEKLLDFELASNNGGWQWAAGTGVDAAPYFRVFNPQLQLEKFDKDYLYVEQWVKEWGTSSYPQPMVDHSMARNRCIEVYKSALSQS